MEFHIEPVDPTVDPAAIETAIGAVDPSVIVDRDPSTGALRVATAMRGDQLIAVLNRAGFAVSPRQVQQIPSVCCGGCSG